MSNNADLLLRTALQTLDPDECDELLRSQLLGQLTGGMAASTGVVQGGCKVERVQRDLRRFRS